MKRTEGRDSVLRRASRPSAVLLLAFVYLKFAVTVVSAVIVTVQVSEVRGKRRSNRSRVRRRQEPLSGLPQFLN